MVTTDAQAALRHSKVVILATPMSGWETYLKKILPHIPSDSTIITLQSQVSLKLIVQKIQKTLGQNQKLTLVSSDFLPFACRSNQPENKTITTTLSAVKEFTNVVIDPRENEKAILPLLHQIIPKKIIQSQRGLELLLTPSNASNHVPIMLGLYKQEHNEKLPAKFYCDISDLSLEFVEKLNEVYKNIIREIKKSHPDFKVPYEGDFLAYISAKYSHLISGLEVQTLLDFFRKNPLYQNFHVPLKEGKLDVQSRFLTEDIPFVLVPIWDVAQTLGMQTPVLTSMILDAQKIMGKEYITADDQPGAHFKETTAPRNFGLCTFKEIIHQY